MKNEIESAEDLGHGARNDAHTALFIREIDVADAEAAARLSEELGYPTTPQVMAVRIQRLAHLADRVVFVACLSQSVVGWIDVGVVHHVQADPYVEIGGLVVSSAHRSAGIGQKLIQRAEEWARNRRVATMVVRSRIARQDAHRFYVREGYEKMKTSVVFSKVL